MTGSTTDLNFVDWGGGQEITGRGMKGVSITCQREEGFTMHIQIQRFIGCLARRHSHPPLFAKTGSKWNGNPTAPRSFVSFFVCC